LEKSDTNARNCHAGNGRYLRIGDLCVNDKTAGFDAISTPAFQFGHCGFRRMRAHIRVNVAM
jgi:hypothetical protein